MQDTDITKLYNEIQQYEDTVNKKLGHIDNRINSIEDKFTVLQEMNSVLKNIDKRLFDASEKTPIVVEVSDIKKRFDEHIQEHAKFSKNKGKIALIIITLVLTHTIGTFLSNVTHRAVNGKANTITYDEVIELIEERDR